MKKSMDVKTMYALLDDAERQLESVGSELRRLLEDVERKVLPEEAAVEALKESLGEVAGTRRALREKSAALDDVSESDTIADWRQRLAAYEERCANAAGREALALLQRLYSEDEECQAAIESFRASVPSWEAAVLDKKKPELLQSIKVLMEAFREEKPMQPLRKTTSYTMKLKGLPEILISAATLDDPPLLLHEQEDAAADQALEAKGKGGSALSPAASADDGAQAREAAPSADAGASMEEEEVALVPAPCFARIREKCMQEHPLLDIEDHCPERKPTAKNIKNYLKQGGGVIGSLRRFSLIVGMRGMFTAPWVQEESGEEAGVVESVLADMVQRGFLRLLHFRDLPSLYGAPGSLYPELCTKDALRILRWEGRPPQPLDESSELLPLNAVQELLSEKARLHAGCAKMLRHGGEVSSHVDPAASFLTVRGIHKEKRYVFAGGSPSVKWMKRVRSECSKASAKELYLLGCDDLHIEEMREFLEAHGVPAARIAGMYVWERDAWTEPSAEEAADRAAGAADAESVAAPEGEPAVDPQEAESASNEPKTRAKTAEVEDGRATQEAEAEAASVAEDALDGSSEDAAMAASEEPATEETPSAAAALPAEEAPARASKAAGEAEHGGERNLSRRSGALSAEGGAMTGALLQEADVKENVHVMLEAGDFASASAYLHAAAYFSPRAWKQMNQELAYALFAPLQKCRYSSNALMDIYFMQSMGEPHEGLAVSAMLWNFYLDHTPYDYGMQSLLDMAKSLELFKEAPGFSDALYTLMQFKKEEQSGADKYADYRLKDKSRMEEKLQRLQAKAREYEDTFIHGHITENGSNRRFIETQKMIFDARGELANVLHFVGEGDRAAFEIVREYVVATFLEGEVGAAGGFEEQNISALKIDRLIDECWHRAGNLVLIRRLTSRLVGAFRSSLQKRLEKIAVLLTQWLKCCDALGVDDADRSLLAYSMMRTRLIEQLERARESVGGTALPAWEQQVLSHTIDEIVRRLRGDYDEKEQRYFYVSFLQTPHVLLDDDFLPRIEQPVGDLESFFPVRRIEQHFAAEKRSFAARLREILDGGDDLGSARLIIDYLKDIGEPLTPELQDMVEHLASDSVAAHAEIVKKDFVESLELAQSYGQIESAAEDRKEKILETVEAWFVRCRESGDYGFFAAIVEAFKKKIEVDAEHRGKALSKELDELQTNLPLALDEEEGERREAKILKIRGMIESKNYTVAEDMLHRFGEDADDSPLESLQTDELQDFLRFYDIVYKKVYDSSRALPALMHLRGHNKATRGGESLLDAWPKGKTRFDRSGAIRQLLRGLGFSVSSVASRPLIGTTENYEALLEEAAGGRRNYAHPFAAFGSKATEIPFRVICLYGKFDADALIARFKEIGTSRHTLVLLDYALQKNQRNRLARKTKIEIPECCFAVIDRVVIGYLAEHYAETKINRMMLSITMPYTFYQPYIPNAANAMPPEMFMGRKEALDKIVNPLGENIVYGGRQLGKSALLRMAEYMVNRMGDGSFAVMVDIKSCGIEEAALRISREFVDRKILAADCETQDWSQLARAIRLRLDETGKRIPYLLLLIDEADAFIEKCKAIDYRPFEELKNIQTIGQERFKFVIAGLRNVVRFDKEALSKNSVLAHLKSYTVRPFSATEARELLEVPLACLGLRFPEENQALVSMILATTNYFPGLIQLYCYKLLEAMKKDYAGYEEASTPPYAINEKHIKRVLAEADFQQDIYNKFDITLRVDEDCYYHILAILMADLYHEGKKPEGYLPQDLLDHGRVYSIKKIEDLSLENVHALMEELRELNIFRLTAGGRYLFARYNFFQLMGSKEHLEDELLAYMEG